MSDETPTWRQAEKDAQEAAREWVESGVWYRGEYEDAVDPYDAASEYADGTADVIYTYRARAIWMDSSEVQEWEDEVDEVLGASGESADIDRRITLCVYMALRNAFEEAAREAIDKLDDEVEA